MFTARISYDYFEVIWNFTQWCQVSSLCIENINDPHTTIDLRNESNIFSVIGYQPKKDRKMHRSAVAARGGSCCI